MLQRGKAAGLVVAVVVVEVVGVVDVVVVVVVEVVEVVDVVVWFGVVGPSRTHHSLGSSSMSLLTFWKDGKPRAPSR